MAKLKTIILAAGSGTRLLPLTENIPKCLVEVGEIPILINTLNCLNKNCIEECVIVVGHHAEKVMGSIGNEFEDIKITYVENKIFEKTGNIYSLWLAKLYLNDEALGRKCRLIAVGFYDKSFKKCRRIANPKIILSQDRMMTYF